MCSYFIRNWYDLIWRMHFVDKQDNSLSKFAILSIWDFTNKVHLNKVFVNQKKLVTIITGVHFRGQTSPILNNLHIFKLSNCSLYMCSIFIYKVLMINPDNEFFLYQNPMYTTGNYSSRKLLLPFVRTSC